MPTTISPRILNIDDGRIEKLLRAIAEERGDLVVEEADFEDNYEHEPYFMRAIEGDLIRFTSGGAYSIGYHIYLRPKGWRALGIERRSLLAAIGTRLAPSLLSRLRVWLGRR